MNSYDSFKKDIKDVAGGVLLTALFFWIAFYPGMVVMGATNLTDKNNQAKYWKRVMKSAGTWAWLVCASILTYMIVQAWKHYPVR